MDTLSEKPAGLAETDCDRKVKLNDHEDETDYKMKGWCHFLVFSFARTS